MSQINKIINYILIAIPLAMGVAAAVLSLLATLQGDPAPDMTFLLGLGLASLSIYSLDALDVDS